MRHHPKPYNRLAVGLFELDGTEKVSEVADAVTARRAEVDALEQEEVAEQRLLALAGHLPHHYRTFPVHYKPRKWPGLPTYSHKMWRPYRERRVRPGDGTLRHSAPVAGAVERCREAGLEFWALAPRGGVWAVDRNRRYVLIERYGKQEAWTATEPVRG